ncbi:AraC family transcriptional regulator [Muricauda sp. SCSIO 64092]|uniref:helix-turn-helix domain-containing protein n=1 Tax=Allomuricauda sp. SCSIO 64092 TaxID=2908842 RepID=UPI001FF46AA7|nr:AraC family transcriptional regulator [Muricauda sp. SCSIO 64092]UOY06784.1 AraC family transcriptional regulator [Muricauda sp. SCSIO 64092]
MKKIYIKNMVCPRCITAVRDILDDLDIAYREIVLGEVTLPKALDVGQKEIMHQRLEKVGFALVNDRRSQLIEKMKNLVIEKVHHSREPLEINWSDYISDQLHLDYKYLGNLFSSVESITFEQYIIHQKIERIKELLAYDEMSLKEIAFLLDYSSVAYLSNQFKKVTGMSPTQFKKGLKHSRRSIDEI